MQGIEHNNQLCAQMSQTISKGDERHKAWNTLQAWGKIRTRILETCDQLHHQIWPRNWLIYNRSTNQATERRSPSGQDFTQQQQQQHRMELTEN